MICDIAENGLVGVEKVKLNQYDAIIMDIRMPKMDGLTATKEIRKFDKTVPILALSANTYEEDVKKSKEVGIDVHLSKPIIKEKLYKELEKIMIEKRHVFV